VIGKFVVVLERSELGFGVRIIVAHVWAAMRAPYAQLSSRNKTGCAVISRRDQRASDLTGLNAFRAPWFGYEMLSKFSVGATYKHPPNDKSAEDVQHHSSANHSPLCGPRSFVMSQLNTSRGPVATSSGL